MDFSLILDSSSQAKAELQMFLEGQVGAGSGHGYSDWYFSGAGLRFQEVGFMRAEVLSVFSVSYLQHLEQLSRH